MNRRNVLWMSLVVLASMAGVCPAQVDPSARIYWVEDNFEGDKTDQGFIDLLTNAGYTPDMSFANMEARELDDTELEWLNRADLIIISRDSDSRQFDDSTAEILTWNTKIARPILNLNAFYMQANRWNWLPSSDTWHYEAGPMLVTEPNHPVMEGVTIGPDGLVDVVTTQTTFAMGATDAAGGTVIGVRADNGFVWLAAWDTTQKLSTGYLPSGPRMLFCCGVDEATTGKQPVLPGNGAYNLTEEGSKIFLNAVEYLLSYRVEKAVLFEPADKAVLNVSSVVLDWAPADGTSSDDVYFGESLEAVTNATRTSPEFKGNQVETSYTVDGLVAGQNYYWRIDGVTEDPDNPIKKGDVWSFLIAPLIAYDPSPVSEARLISLDPVLSWRAGTGALLHMVYFGTSADAVANADLTSPEYKGPLQAGDLTWSPVAEGMIALENDTQYFWRVDEQTADELRKGDLWSFQTTMPGLGTCTLEIWTDIDGRQVDDLRADPRYPDSPTEVNERTSFYSGNDLGDWYGGRIKAWLHVPFTGDYTFKLGCFSPAELWLSTAPGDHTQTQLIVSVPIERLPQNDWRYSSAPITLEEGKRYYIQALWKETEYGDYCQVGWEGPGIRDIEVIQGGYLEPFVDLWAFGPNPPNGAVDVKQAATLRWTAGAKAAQHDVYFGDDETAVADANTTTPEIYRGRQALDDTKYVPTETPLDPNKTYYWRIDEIDDTNPDSPWKGNVWSFTTAEFLVLDDIESYNDLDPDDPESNRIFFTWIDGWEVPTNGSQVGYSNPPFCEQTIVHGGQQSMPLRYDNSTAAYSEATVNVANLQADQDWSKYGIKTLSLWFYGDPCNVAQQMYVKLNGVKVLYDGDADNMTQIGWQPWNIELVDFTGVDLGNVTELSIGLERIGAVGGSGIVYIDDIRLYPFVRELITPAEPSNAGLVAHYEFEGTTNDSSGNGRHGTAMGSPTFVTGKIGQAINLRGLNDYVEITGYKGILGPNAITVTAWIRTTSTAGTIVNWGTQSTGQRIDFRVNADRLRVEPGGGNIQGDSNVNDGNWHHVAVTIHANATISYPEVILYLDGRDDTTPTTDPGGFNITANVDVSIGYRATNNDRFFMGQIDDVRIYDYALSDAEVAWLSGRTKPFDKPF